ncbi:hypothetical protein QQ056_17550 [Oscillatoria laete-virens NRMC-F 0139]|nr:hypothetical protein [Oscillatoria laete-virens]MDL5055340.1 hypothetical protein [Oscillatoria laete-virens NRMC-F 0139]
MKRNYAGVKLRKFSSDTIRLILQKAIQDQVTLSQITRYFKRLNQEMYPSYPTILFRVSKIFMRHYRRWLMTEAKAKAFRKEADLRKQNLHRMIQEVA